MDKILAFSILSSSPADLSAASGFSTRLSWRTSSSAAAGTQKQQQQPEKAPRQEDKATAAERRSPRPAAPAMERKARFAPEFDGINCFESIVSF